MIEEASADLTFESFAKVVRPFDPFQSGLIHIEIFKRKRHDLQLSKDHALILPTSNFDLRMRISAFLTAHVKRPHSIIAFEIGGFFPSEKMVETSGIEPPTS